MVENHLTTTDVDLYVERELDDAARLRMDQHLAACAPCRGRVARAQRIEATLRTLPREKPSRDLASRISAAVELRVVQEQTRRARMPFTMAATFFSMLLSLWFGTEVVVAIQENGALDLFTLFTSRPDLLSAYSWDAAFALIEALPIYEILLTVFALLTAVVLAQQLIEAIQPRVAHVK